MSNCVYHKILHIFNWLITLGIPVVAFNTRPIDDDRQKNPYMAYVGMDDYLAGKAMARYLLAKELDLKKVVVGLQSAGHAGLESRYLGIYEVLAPKGVAVNKLDTGSDPREAMRIGRSYIAKHPDLSGQTAIFSYDAETERSFRQQPSFALDSQHQFMTATLFDQPFYAMLSPYQFKDKTVFFTKDRNLLFS